MNRQRLASKRKADKLDSAENIAITLGGKYRSGQWHCYCPCHDDSTRSLSIKEGESRVLLYCFAGCSYDDLVRVLRLEGIHI